MNYLDFCKPNPVLLYGCGGIFQLVTPKLLDMKINILGVIDINKTGMAKIKDIEIPIYNIDEVINKFGNDLRIIITLQNLSLINEVKNNLIECGFNKDKIVDVNQIMWLTMPSEKSFCSLLGRNVNILTDFISTCCIPSANKQPIVHLFLEGEEEDKIVDTLLDKYKFYRQESLKGCIPLFCTNCPCLSNDKSVLEDTILKVGFAVNTYCNSDCVYCDDGISKKRDENILSNHEQRCKVLSKIMRKLKQKNLLDEKSSFSLVGGEITINPNKKLLYDIANSIPNNPIWMFTNGFIYDEDIKNILDINPNALLTCDMDAGTRISYIKVKGFDKFTAVCDNLKRYGNSNKIILKYIIKPGWNDTDDDILGTVDLLKFLSIDNLVISPDFKYIDKNNKEMRREIGFSAAKFIIALEQNSLKYFTDNRYWPEEYIVEINRMVNALKSAGYTIKSNQF